MVLSIVARMVMLVKAQQLLLAQGHKQSASVALESSNQDKTADAGPKLVMHEEQGLQSTLECWHFSKASSLLYLPYLDFFVSISVLAMLIPCYQDKSFVL